MQLQIQLKFLSLLQNYIQRYFQIALGFFNSLFLKKNSISFLCLIALYSNANGIDQGQPNESAINYFIEFKPGIYNQPKDNNIDYLLTEINHLSTEQIKIKGISQSESDIATMPDSCPLTTTTILLSSRRMRPSPARISLSKNAGINATSQSSLTDVLQFPSPYRRG